MRSKNAASFVINHGRIVLHFCTVYLLIFCINEWLPRDDGQHSLLIFRVNTLTFDSTAPPP